MNIVIPKNLRDLTTLFPCELYIVGGYVRNSIMGIKTDDIDLCSSLTIDELEKVLKGSDSVVVDRLEDNSGLQVQLAQSVISDINSKLAKPTTPTAESAVTMLADGTVGTIPLSEIGGGGKLYLHIVPLKKSDNAIKVNITFYSLSDQSTSDSMLMKITKINGLLYKGEDDIGKPLVGVFYPSNEYNFDLCDFNGIDLVTGQTVEASSAKFIKENEIITEM